MQNSSSTQNPPTPQSIRIVHAALTAGILLFAIVAHFVLLPNANTSGNLATMIPMLLAVALALCALPMLLMKRVPRPTEGESPSAFWLRAASPALVTWTPLEGAALLCVTLYSHTGSKAAIAVGALAVLIMLLLRPGYFEGR
jgi:FtsH-binding integral membrane protein